MNEKYVKNGLKRHLLVHRIIQKVIKKSIVVFDYYIRR